MKHVFFLLCLYAYSALTVFAQETSPAAFEARLINWYNKDLATDQIMGASVDKAYTDLLKDMTVKKVVVVAVIDGGIDIQAEDLQGKIWINEDEIPGNQTDDDHNGYVDDINGWNFIGSKSGNLKTENLEYTRIVKMGPDAPGYKKAKEAYEKELQKRLSDRETLDRFMNKYKGWKKTIKAKTGVDVSGMADLEKVNSTNPEVLEAVRLLRERYEMGLTEKKLNARIERNKLYLEKHLNLDINPRELVGDNPEIITDRNYGNPDVKGPRASHGTCSAGIIAGIRGNGVGVDGVAEQVRIMVLRVVPEGDERDKDVALAIRYAVDNGADIINMSFGKEFSPQRQFVDEAIRYAEQKNVLMIHSAGNNGYNLDKNPNYPSDIYLDETEASNFMNIGASRINLNDSLACIFSNYGRKHVDLFAPGEDIIAIDTNNYYDIHSGTSQAGPVVAGVAAVILAYYPDLKPAEVITLLMETATDLKAHKVLIPNLTDEKRKSVKFGKLSKSGGIVNLYQALQRLKI